MAEMLTGPTDWTIRCGAVTSNEQAHCAQVKGMWTGPWGTMVCPGIAFGDAHPKCSGHGSIWMLVHENLLTKPQGVGDKDGYVWSDYARGVLNKLSLEPLFPVEFSCVKC